MIMLCMDALFSNPVKRGDKSIAGNAVAGISNENRYAPAFF